VAARDGWNEAGPESSGRTGSLGGQRRPSRCRPKVFRGCADPVRWRRLAHCIRKQRFTLGHAIGGRRDSMKRVRDRHALRDLPLLGSPVWQSLRSTSCCAVRDPQRADHPAGHALKKVARSAQRRGLGRRIIRRPRACAATDPPAIREDRRGLRRRRGAQAQRRRVPRRRGAGRCDPLAEPVASFLASGLKDRTPRFGLRITAHNPPMEFSRE